MIEDFEIGPDFKQALGQVVMAAAECESRISDAVEAYVGGPHAWMVARGLPINALIDALSSVANDPAFEVESVAVKDVVAKAKALFEKRNGVVHGAWLPIRMGDNGGYPALRRRRNQKMLKGQTYTLEDLHALAGDFSTLNAQIWLMLPGRHDDEE